MSDKPSLLFRRKLGGLFPANAAAGEALSALDHGGEVRVEIRKTRGNNKRLNLYWACLNVAVPHLQEKAPGLTVTLLHNVLKDRAGLVKVVTLPSGQQIKDYESVSFARMPENERAEYITFALNTLASWLGVEPQTLLEEAA